MTRENEDQNFRVSKSYNLPIKTKGISDMFVIDGRQVDLDLISIPQLDGLVIPNGLKKKLLDQLNWQDFIRSHCRRRNLGFSAQDCFHSRVLVENFDETCLKIS